MILDQLIVLFSTEGADKVKATIDEISKKIAKGIAAQRKAASVARSQASERKEREREEKTQIRIEEAKEKAQLRVQSLQEKQRIGIQKESEKYRREVVRSKKVELNVESTRAKVASDAKTREIKQNAVLQKEKIKNSRELIKNKKVEFDLTAKQTKLEAWQEDREERKTRQEKRDRYFESKNQFNALAKLAIGVVGLGFAVKALNSTLQSHNQKMLSMVAGYGMSGMSSSKAQGFEQMLQGFGAQEGEGLRLASGITADIGSMRYGDTGLVEKLGKYGIGGVGAHSKTEDVMQAIARKIQSSNEYTQAAIARDFGLSAEALSAFKAGNASNFIKAGKPLTVSDEQRGILQEQVELNRALNQVWNTFLTDYAPVISKGLRFLSDNAGWATSVATIATALTVGSPFVSLLGNIVGIFGRGGTFASLIGSKLIPPVAAIASLLGVIKAADKYGSKGAGDAARAGASLGAIGAVASVATTGALPSIGAAGAGATAGALPLIAGTMGTAALGAGAGWGGWEIGRWLGRNYLDKYIQSFMEMAMYGETLPDYKNNTVIYGATTNNINNSTQNNSYNTAIEGSGNSEPPTCVNGNFNLSGVY